MFARTRIRASAAIIGAALGMTLSAGPMVVSAFAADNDPYPASKNCELYLPGEGVQWLPPGTKVIVKLDDGTKKTYECKEGEWVAVDKVLGITLRTVPVSALPIRR